MNLSNLKQKNVADLAILKENGQKIVGVFCTYCPRELILAADALAISLCAYNEEPINAAHKDLPRNLCALIKASYGHSLNNSCPYMNASDLIVGETTCDGKKKMYELMKNQRDVHIMELPNMRNENSLKLFKAEIYKLKDVLEEKFNVKITDEKLKEAIILQNKERELMQEIMNLATFDPSPISGVELHEILFANDFIFDKKEKFKILENLITKYKEKIGSMLLEKNKRVLVTGCPSGGVFDKIIKEMENFDVTIVGFENCIGSKNFDNLVEIDGDLYENLAKRYLKIPCSVMFANDARITKIKEMVKKFNVSGVIDITLSACHTYAIEASSIKNACKEIGVKYLNIETDYSKQDSGQIKTRLEAFSYLL